MCASSRCALIPCIPQMASVCTTFRTAAHTLLRRWPGLDLEHDDTLPDRLDSKLLLEWAPTCFWRLWLGHDSLEVPGMFAFLLACEQLIELEVECLDMLACQRVNACLGRLSRLAILRCSGWLVPTSLPHCLNELVVDLSRWSTASLCVLGLDGVPEALLLTLADAPDLEYLSLNLGGLPNLPAMAGLVLQQLQQVCLDFKFDASTPIDLGWLKGQNAQEVCLTIALLSGEEAELVRLVEQLQALTIHDLHVALHAGVEEAAQRQWAKLFVQHNVTFLMYTSHVLMAVPQCARLHFRLGASEEAPHVVVIAWAVLSSCIGRLYLFSGRHGHFSLPNFTGHAPDRGHPWQLWTDRPPQGFVERLTASEGGWRLQNHAADAAGWS